MSAPRSPRRRRPSRATILLGALAVAAVGLTTGQIASSGQMLTVADAAARSALHGGGGSSGGGNVFSSLFGGFFGGGHSRPGRGPAPTTIPATSTPVAAPSPPGTPNSDCTLVVPSGPLTAAGLATPYRLQATDPAAGACHEANPDQSAFVEATILDPATGAVSVYHPLVIDDGTRPALTPARPALPPRAVVGVWFGYQANILTLRSRRFHHGVIQLRTSPGDACVNGSPGSPFGQFAYCGAPQFFASANAAIRAGKLTIPPLGTAIDGQPCPTTRSFAVVDQDQSDNLPGKYLATADGRTAQFSAANQAALPGSTLLTNASDNGLVDGRLDPALGCHPFTAPDLSQGGAPSASLAMNELQAAADQTAPIALVPPNDPMTLDGTAQDIAKTNLYRAGVDMVPVDPATDTGLAYCRNLAQVAPARLALDQQYLSSAPSPDPAESSLFGFLTARLAASWTNLGCDTLTGDAAPVVGAPPTTGTTATPPAPPVPATPAVPVPAAQMPVPATSTPVPATTPAVATPAGTPPGSTTPDQAPPTP